MVQPSDCSALVCGFVVPEACNIAPILGSALGKLGFAVSVCVFDEWRSLCCGRSQEQAEVDDGVTIGSRAEVPSVVPFVIHIDTFCLYHHQSSIDAFSLDNKTLVGCQLYLEKWLSVKYWMVFYKFMCLYTVTNPWHSPPWYAPNSKPRLVITSLFSFPLNPVFRSRLRASAAALALAHLSARYRGPGLEGAHAIPGLLPHSLGSPALHGWAAARETCLLVFCLTTRACFGGPSAVEAPVGWGGLYSLISSGFLWVTCLALTWLLMACEPEPEPEPLW